MLRITLLFALGTPLGVLLSAANAQAWGAYHVGYTHVGPSGVYHYGHTAAAGPYGSYSGGHTSAYGAYGGAYHSGYSSGDRYGAYGAGYHYGYGGYSSGYRYGGAYGDAYRAGVYRRW